MRKAWFISAMALLSTVIGAQDYQISFAILDDNETLVDSVVVHNIEQDNIITLRGNDILHLVASTTGISNLNTLNGKVEVYPNPFSKRATIVFQNAKQGLVQLSLFDMTGKIVAKNSLFQSAGKTIVEVSGLPAGAYVIQIDTETSIFSEVILSNDASGTTPEIIFKGSQENDAAPVTSLKSSNRTGELVEMQYNAGDTMSLTAYLGDLNLETKIVPVASSTISFDFRPDLEEISTTATITIDGGVLQVSDESGNIVKLTFPPGAVMDSTTVSLTLLGERKDLPIGERLLRSFEIRPLDINLYEPVLITIEYNTPISEIEKAALFRLRSDEWLTPLSDHVYSEDSSSMTASTLFLGDFAEGKMTLAQLNTQFDLLVSFLGISWESDLKAAGTGNQILCDTKIHKATWDAYRSFTGSLLSFFRQRLLYGHYNDLEEWENTWEEDQAALCSEVVSVGVQSVLDQCIPDDLCDRDYTHTIADMIAGMWLLGCEGSTLDLLEERMDQMLIDCATSLTITSQLNIESGGIEINTIGAIPITMTASGNNTATIDSYGTLEVSGSGNAGGDCTAVVAGGTFVNVYGTKDAAYTYELQVLLAQTAVLVTTCPDGSSAEAPLLNNAETREVTLSSANGHSVTIEESGDGYSFIMDVELINAHTSFPAKE